MSIRYTLGDWRIAPGSEQEFIDAWTELAEWTASEVAGSGSAKLLRDTRDPQRFVSFGPWDDQEAVATWRALPGFQDRIARLSSMTESFEPRMLSVEREVG
jgi:heme-degrading monooxygenase HmoA